MCGEPTVLYGPTYKLFIFGNENVAMKKGEAEEVCVEKGENLIRGDSCDKNGSDESKGRKRCCDKKGSVDYELPELVVFLQESSYHFVKDICVDKKMHSHSNCLVENCELDHKIISCILESDTEAEPEAEEVSNNNDAKKNGGSEKCLTKGDVFDSPDGVSAEKSTKEIVLESLHLVAEVQKAILTSSETPRATEKKDDSIQIITERRKTDSSSESGSTATNLDESRSQIHRNSSAFGSGHFSGLITQRGTSPPSFRSLSRHSNSSTTSSRSFAFPVLASEWHGSPERMVKPEKRASKKTNKGKCARFLCCNLKVFE